MDRSAPKVAVRPIPIKRAILFVREVHRRLPAIQGGMWAIAAEIEGETVGVIIVGHPQARMACDGVSLEVTRCAVREGARNASSALYGAAARAAKAMGALDFWTTIHGDESGHSLKAAARADRLLKRYMFDDIQQLQTWAERNQLGWRVGDEGSGYDKR